MKEVKTFCSGILTYYIWINLCLTFSGLLCGIQCWIRTKCSFGINFKIWDSETAEGLVLINILRDSLDIKGTVNKTFFDCI